MSFLFVLIEVESKSKRDVSMSEHEEEQQTDKTKTVDGGVGATGGAVYDYNPIVNYFYYNQGTEKKTLTERLVEVDDYTREMFTRHGLRVCTVKMSNCLGANSLFANVDPAKKMPVKLTRRVLDSFGLKPANTTTTVVTPKPSKSRLTSSASMKRSKSSTKLKENSKMTASTQPVATSTKK